MYKISKTLHRIDWIYSKYGNTDATSLEDFIAAVNNAYYSASANLYSSRFVEDISDEYKKMFTSIKIKSESAKRFIVDIGGGAGFEYELLKKCSIDFRHFKYIEPSKDMMKVFMGSSDVAADHKLSFHNEHFSEVVDQIREEPNKLLIINSALHHVIWIEPMLDDIKSSMKEGDLFVLGHEPNNDYSRVFMTLQKAFRAIFTSVLLKKILPQSKSSGADTDRWKAINLALLKSQHIKREMSPLLIRRIIDYGVGYKKDWKKLNIPEEFNEGFWNTEDLSSYLGPDFSLLYFQTYRHLGDSHGNVVIECMNRILSTVLRRHGTNFIAVWVKNRRH